MKPQSLFLITALVALLFLPATATAQVWFGIIPMVGNRGAYYKNTDLLFQYYSARVENGGQLDNFGNIYSATVNGGTLCNYYNYNNDSYYAGKIIDATVNGGALYNYSRSDRDYYSDSDVGIYRVTVKGGALYNYGGGVIDSATVNGGVLYNGDDYGWAVSHNVDVLDNFSYIHNVTVNDGVLYNDMSYGGYNDNGSCGIGSATVNGGTLYNHAGGGIDSATVNGGILNNACAAHYVVGSNGNVVIYYGGEGDYMNGVGHITNVTQNDGTVNNSGSIWKMTYVSGTYNGLFECWAYNPTPMDWESHTGFGTIGTLTLAGDSALNTGDWGIIEKLVFDNSGDGIASLTAFVDGGGFGFSGIKADYVDFTYGNISLDLTALGGMSDLSSGFYLADLFGSTAFCGVENLLSLGVTFGDESFWILNGDGFGKGWSIDSTTGFVSYEVPEPATLLMLGLAAAGIPVVRRLRKG